MSNNKLTDQIKELREEDQPFNKKDIDALKKASEKLERLKKEGYVKKKEYNLLTADDAHLKRTRFNTSKNEG